MIEPILRAKIAIKKINNKWDSIIDLLEPLSTKRNLSPIYNYELGFAYCKKREWGKAYSNLKKAVSIKKK